MDEVVNQEEVVVTEQPNPAEVVTEVVPRPGDKTEPNLLLKSLREEREKTDRLEAELKALKQTTTESGEVYSDEGKALLKKISALETQLSAKQQAEILQGVTSTYPVLKDKQAEFEQFMADNPGMRTETAAKAFLVENDLLETPKPRKGLENNSGGGRVPVQSDGMSAKEADDLRVNNFREYSKRIKAGTLIIKS